MDPPRADKPDASGGESQTSAPRQPGRKRRSRSVKLEERIAPATGQTNSHAHHGACGS